jgi:predicted nicotinamide N-methyase
MELGTHDSNADEEDFLQLVVANDIVLRWLDKWEAYESEGDAGEKKLAVLLRDVARTLSEQKGEAYASEAASCGLADRAVATMKRYQHSPDLLDDLSAIIVACSGPLAQGDKVVTLSFGGYEVTVKEGALADGVGAKLWRVARIMCEKMVRDMQAMIRGKSVLEVGAGVGACGFLAAKMAATSVVISDYVDKLLVNLKDALELNFQGELSNDGGWTRANAAVRFIDWEDSVNRNDGEGAPPAAALDGDSSRTIAPHVDTDSKFDTILGTDVLYEWPMVKSLSSCIKQRLAPGGTAYICNAIRDQAMFDALVDCIRDKDLVVDVQSLDVERDAPNEDGRWCQDDAYEGGFVFLTISHRS